MDGPLLKFVNTPLAIETAVCSALVTRKPTWRKDTTTAVP